LQPNGSSDAALNIISQQLQFLANQIAHLQGGAPQPYTNGPSAHSQLNGKQVTATPVNHEPDISAEEMVEIKKPFGATARIERVVQGLDDKQMAFLANLTKEYNAKTKKSKEQTQQHRAYMADPRVVSGFRPLTKEVVYP
jgi:hypothetical protein